MGRLTIEIPENTHHQLRVMAAHRGVTIRDYVLDRILPELMASTTAEPSLPDLAAAWKERKQSFRLERGDKSWTEVFHAGHKW